jgi:uncharacterized protein YfaS (alpha-2-macroglobulin family)
VKRTLVLSVTALIICAVLFSCEKKEEREAAPPRTAAEWLAEELDLDEAIVRAPAGIVSATVPLDIEFREPVIPAHLVGTVLDKNPFTFEPPIQGQAKWQSQRTLRFMPDGYLPAGAEVKAVLNGTAAFGDEKKVNDFLFSFKVAEQEVLSLVGDFVAVPERENAVQYTGTFEFAQPVDVDKIQAEIEFRGPDGKVNLAVTPYEDPHKAGVKSRVILRTDKGRSFTISLPPRYSAEGKRWERPLFLPEIGVFRVLSHTDMTSPDDARPTYGFRFSDPIKQDIDLSGFVSVTPEVAYDVRIQGKYLLLAGAFNPGQSYTVKIAKGFPSTYGTKMPGEFNAEFSISNMRPEIEWLQHGVYIPTDNTFRLQFKSVNVGRVQIAVTEIYPENIGFFIQRNTLVDAGETRRRGRYRSGVYEDLDRVGTAIHIDTLEIAAERNRWVKSELDLSPVFRGKKNSAFFVLLKFGKDDLTGRCVNDRDEMEEGDLFYESANYYENPCSPGYYYTRGAKHKLLISSDVGLTVKHTEDGVHVFAADVLRARPVSGLDLGLYTYQNQLVETKTTDRDGHALFGGHGSYIYGTNSSGIALIKLNHPPWEVNTFDVGGAVGGKSGTDVFIYTDRGVHRPGDTIHLSAVIRMNGEVPPEKQPVILKVRNARGQIAHEARASCGFNGHVYFAVPTELSDPTGDWSAGITVGDQTFTRTLKVETVKPFRLKIDVDMPEAFHPPHTDITGTITCKYLFGAPAADLRSSIRADLSSGSFTTEKHGDFIFSTPMKQYERRTVEILETRLDGDGTARFSAHVPNLKLAPGLVRVNLNINVYEKGGSFATHRRVTTVYPYTAFVGLKNIFAGGYAEAGETYQLPIIVTDHEGNPVPGHRLDVAVYVNQRHWWYDYDRRDRQDFRRMESTYLIGECTYHSGTAPVVHTLPVEDNGRHFIEVRDITSGHEAGMFFYAYAWGRPAPADEEERNYLKITSDKNVYAVGDEATLTFDSPGEGMALLTIEKGDVLIRRRWKTLHENRTSFMIPLAEDLMPNCYASISMIQPHNQNTNDLPMRLYGIKTLYIEDESTHLPLQLSAPDELKPKEAFSIDVTSRAPMSATYTIAVVDEGLLDLTGFETPVPWNHFFRKVRLGVTTRDNFDEILGVLYPDIDRYFTIGGGEAYEEKERAKRLGRARVTRFVPVVLFEGPVRIEPGETATTSFTMPNYVGSVRVMVVGTAAHSYASLDETVPVRQSLMILPTLPRVARPGDTFALPVSVFAMDSTVQDVRLSARLSSNLSIEGPPEVRMRFAKPGEADAAFSVMVGNRIGADTATVMATSTSATADYTVHLPVESPNPFFTEVTDTTVEPKQAITLVPEKFGLEGTNAARIAFSRMPDIQLDKRIKYLVRYPYGCIEQTTSSAFPQIFLPYLVDLGSHQKQMVTDNINAAIARLKRFQMNEGSSFWPVLSGRTANFSDWGSSYAGHFLIEARERGYHVPGGLYNHWLRTAKKRAKQVNTENHRYQMYRLFLLALAGEPHVGAMNLVRENYLSTLDPLSRKLLAAAYYVSGEKDAARVIDRSAPTEIPPFRELGGTYGSALRDRALMTYLCVKMEDMQAAGRLLRATAKEFTPGGWYSTQETAMALLAIGSYYQGSPFTGGAVTFRVKTGEKEAETVTLSGYQTMRDLVDVWGEEIVITNESDNPLFVTLLVEGIPLDERIETEFSGLHLARNFFDADGRPIDVSARRQGEGFWIVYTVENQYSMPLRTLALTSVFPSGWEIVNRRVTGQALPPWVQGLGATTGEYMDIRDDRINWFFDLPERGKVRFAAEINPTFRGRYRLPPVSVEAMYSPEYFARIAGGNVFVK